MHSTKESQIEMVIGGLKKHLPLLADFFDLETPLSTYSKQLYDYTADPVHIQRQAPIANAMKEYIQRVYKRDVDIPLPMITNIVDHHSLLNNPILIATNIVANAHRLLLGNTQPIVVFSTAIPPQDNYFGDIRFHGKRMPFFSKKELPQSTCFLPTHEYTCIERLKHSKKWSSLTAQEQSFITDFETLLREVDTSTAQNLSDQVSVLNNVLWKKCFAKDIRDSVPDLFYIPNEDILLLLSQALLFEDNIISRALFNTEFRQRVLDRFNGLIGCWDSEGTQKGSHFFWHRTSKNRPEALLVEGNALVNKRGTYRIELTPEAIHQAMQQWEIIPGLFVIYGYLSMYAGIRPLVGYGSLNYITRMKEAWLDVLDLDGEEKERVNSVNTTGVIGGLITNFKREANGELRSQYVMDIMYDSGITREYIEQLCTMQFKHVLMPAALEIYGSYVPADQRQPHNLQAADLIGTTFDWVQ